MLINIPISIQCVQVITGELQQIVESSNNNNEHYGDKF